MGLLDYLHGDHPGESDKRGLFTHPTYQQVRGLLEQEKYGNIDMQDIMYDTIEDKGLKAHYEELDKGLKKDEWNKLRYYNPGNIKNVSKTPKKNWTGSVPGIGYQGGEVVKDGKHAIFTSPVLGLRALFRDVKTKMRKHGGVVSEILHEYAPATENPTEEYIQFVEKFTGGGDASTLAPEQIPEFIDSFVKAIVTFENDDEDLIKLYLSDEVFNEAKKLSKHSLDGRGDLAAAQREHDKIESQ